MVDYDISTSDAFRGLTTCSTVDEHPLSTSDHLPISCVLDLAHVRDTPKSAIPLDTLDWLKAVEEGKILEYSQATDNAVRFLLNKDCSFVEDLNQDILSTASKIRSAATMFIPLKKVKSHLSHKIHDRTLSHLCWKSRCAFCKWKDAGRPRSGLLYDERRKCKCPVQHYLNQQRGNWERKRIQKRDSMFSQKHPQRFRSRNESKHIPEKLLVNGNLITDSEALLSTWASHFEAQGHSQLSSNDFRKDVHSKVQDLEYGSFCESDEVLDVPFDVEEVEHALKRLKSKRAGGPDNLSPEHLKHYGPVFTNWLCQIYNCICELEQIPPSFKQGIVIPAFKGKGRDPLLIKSYRG